MALIDNKITDTDISTHGVVSAPDKLTGTAAQNKAVFDNLIKQAVKMHLNALIDDLVATSDGASGADNIGATAIKAGGAVTVQGQLEGLQADKAENADLLTHKSSADHDGRYYTKTELQTTGSSTVHWGNLTNVPNLADGHWKPPVADKASLPLTGNSTEDCRVVLDDGDGKQAVYLCIAITGTLEQQWKKIGDVDWITEEATRVTQENARVVAETGRVDAEASRATAENARVGAETARNNAEGLRVTAETGRNNAETGRVNAETTRVNAENARAVFEAYDNATAYIVGNKVSYNGSSYICTANTTGNLPTNTTYWLLIASKGNIGAAFTYADFTPEQLALLKGEKGDKGNTGDIGLQGIQGEQGIQGIQGIQGATGNGIASIIRTSGTGAAGTTDTYTITFTNSTTATFTVYNGANGEGSGDMLANVYDPNNKNADSFNMDNMVSGTTNKVFTATEKTKLSGIAENANNYTHPATHSADIILDGTTNKAYTAAEKSKLAGIEAQATANSMDSVLLDRANHTGTQSADTIIDGTTNKAYTATEKTKLAGIAAGAEVNVNADWNAVSGDAQILNKPTLATVATSGSYNDLGNKPSISDGKRVARFVIGTSTAGWTAADCDYLCDGTADDVEIIAALNDLPATGGEVVILDGTYNITESINVPKDSVSLRGNGNATILKRMYASTGSDSGVTARGVITLNNRNLCTVSGLRVTSGSYEGAVNASIYLFSSRYNEIKDNTLDKNKYGSGISMTASSNNTITGNCCNNNNLNISLTTSNDNVITGNCCNNNGSGISMTTSSNNTITGNTCNNNTGEYGSGISMTTSSNNTVTGNTCIIGTGDASNYTATQHTIKLKGTDNKYNLISNNNCMGKAVTNEGGTGNTLVNNKYNAT